jgi:hypothetical protein
MHLNAIIVTQERFDELNALALAAFQAQGGYAEKWCNPIIHPVDGRIAFTIEPKIESILTEEEQASVIELDHEEWFPPIDSEP